MAATIQNQQHIGMEAPPTEWATFHAPNANVKATCTKAAPGAGKQLVVTSIQFAFVANTTAPTAAWQFVKLIQDSAGTAVELWGTSVALEAVAGSGTLFGIRCNIEIAANKPVTLEFTNAAGANTIESVAMTGYTKNSVTDTPAT